VPQQTIVLLEDIDAAFVQRRAGDPNRGGGVSFSGTLTQFSRLLLHHLLRFESQC
jgi:hypothetical protein